ncbi:SRPBCC domain-containing protein [Sphaerisporangium sp. TRM90804]|uniref:SRPBCC domain-containing protein n=1 Tax=Sphaerisporangium sp. TRM90804 TaxID=3031113 RepID=UPI00244B2FB6|nr:SRPBCC domain-containing protein [Sphaerisporangium sp. TRM90804]MDH2427667.1 SRPBCC domain-containing protein [Sphaerisporangium sp. TRM90804]
MVGEIGEPVAVSRRVEAPAAEIFRVLTDPRRHLDLDGSGMLRGAVTDAVVSAVGDVFVMRMHNDRHGDYEMNNHVVEYEAGRRVGWEPKPGRGHPDESAAESRWGHRWIFDLAPDGAGATIVTEIFDGSRLPEGKRAEMHDGRAWWITSMTSTLERLDELCSADRPAGR